MVPKTTSPVMRQIKHVELNPGGMTSELPVIRSSGYTLANYEES